MFPQGQIYALPQLPASKMVVDDLHQVVYSEIRLKRQGEATSTEPDCTAEQAHEIGNNIIVPSRKRAHGRCTLHWT